MPEVTKELVLSSLSKVMDPELNRDLVSLKMIDEIKIDKGNVSFTLVLTTPACPLRNKIENDARLAVGAIEGVNSVSINVTARVREDQKLKANSDGKIKNIIAVGSGKGGVGKSTVSVNLAVSLAQTGAKVGILDADIYGPNIPLMMGITRLPPTKQEEKIQPAKAYGVKVMSIGFMVEEGQPLIWRGPMLHSAIKQFLTEVDWGDLDYLIVDLPPGTGDVQLSLVQTLPPTGGVIVTTPQQVSIDDAYRAANMFEKLEVPLLGIVENMSYLQTPDGNIVKIFGEGGGAQLAELAGVDLLGTIPLEISIRQGGDEGRPVVIFNPEATSAQELTHIAQSIASELSIRSYKS